MSQDLTYEQALEKLDQQLKLLEDGDLSLEDSLKAVETAQMPESLSQQFDEHFVRNTQFRRR